MIKVCKVLMSIYPEYVNNIISGQKIYEYRKIKCRRNIDCIVIYATSPICKIVAEVEVKGVIEGTPEYVWQETHEGAGLKKTFFQEYFKHTTKAVAYSLGTIKTFSKGKSLSEYGIKQAPQSFVYL